MFHHTTQTHNYRKVFCAGFYCITSFVNTARQIIIYIMLHASKHWSLHMLSKATFSARHAHILFVFGHSSQFSKF